MQDEVNEKSVTKSVGSSSKSAAFDGGKLLQKRKVSVIIFMRKGGGNMTVTVDDKRCIGCGACENLCPSRPFSAIYVEGHIMHRTV
jgi:NAD-dependent dihydropyrimidine dehydrogenase PreA subunit